MVRQRVRIRFGKQGDLRLIGHRDLVRLWERLLRRAGVRLGMSQGFHPKPRMSFPSALALGIEGLEEVVELELSESCTAGELHARLVEHAVQGLSFSAVEILHPGARKAQLRSATYQLPVPPERCAAAAESLGRLRSRSATPPGPSEGTGLERLRQSLAEAELEGGMLRFRLWASRRRSAGPRDVLAALGLEDLEQSGAYLIRTRVELHP